METPEDGCWSCILIVGGTGATKKKHEKVMTLEKQLLEVSP